MQQSKLFTLLSGLEITEFRWLHKFLKSPFYNTNEKVLSFFQYIKKYYPDLDSPKLAKEIAFQYLFPKEQFQAQKMRKLMHELATLVEDFMVAQYFQKNQLERKKALTKELGQRNLYGLFEKGTAEIATDLDNMPYRNKGYFLEKYLNEYQFFAHPSTNPQQDFIPKLFKMSDDLDQFYFLQKLQLNSVLESAKHIYRIADKLPFYESIAPEIKNRGLEQIPAFQLYLLVTQLFQTQNTDEIFKQSYDAFFSKKGNLGEKDKLFILKSLINFAVRKTNEGNEVYVKKGLALYKVGLSENLLVIKNRITEGTFINIAWWSAYLKDFEFASDFIENYKQFLEKERRKEIIMLSKANLYFNLGDYNQVIDLLSINSFSNIIDKLRAKILILKSYFELYLMDESYHNFVLSQVENFERNIRREEKISNNGKISLLNFTKYFKRLLDIKIKKNGLGKFSNDLLKVENISNKPWLIAKNNFLSMEVVERK